MGVRKIAFPIARGLAGLLAALLLVPACGGGGGGGSAPPLPFAVAFTRPLGSPSITPRQTVVYVRFNRDFNETTVTPSTFSVSGLTGTVPGTFSFEHCLFEIRFVPTGALSSSTFYTVTLTVGIQDLAGMALTAVVFNFTTGAQTDIVRPTFGGVTGTTNPQTTTIDLTWNAATGEAGVVTYDVFLSFTSGCFNYVTPYQSTVSPAGVTVTGLSPNTTYYFSVRARDADGNTDLNVGQASRKTLTSFSLNIWPVVQSSCNACHVPGGQAVVAGVDMNYSTAASTYTSWFDAAISSLNSTGPPPGAVRVKSGGTATAVGLSFVYNKIKSKADGVPAWSGSGMPLVGGALTAAQVQTLYDWIFEGATNN